MNVCVTETIRISSSHSRRVSDFDRAAAAAHLGGNRNLQLGFFWSSDGDDRLLPEGLKAADVFVGHVGQRGREVKENFGLFAAVMFVKALISWR